ncbi:hypothetical protein M758_9G094900 [Ceratodon purpureus]|nr:hypothetical protein M758_9G094900 [Ceratodon purpureus]
MACHRSGRTQVHNLTSSDGLSPLPKFVILGQFGGVGGRLHRVLCLSLLLVVAMCFMSFGFWFVGVGSGVSGGVLGESELWGGGDGQRRYLYWGAGVDCPGKHCVRCGGLGHQESSLRCALEEAMFLNRTFVLPSIMCIANEHESARPSKHSEGRLESHGCSMAKLYDLALMSHTVPVILSDSKEWQDTLVRTDVVFVLVEGIKSEELVHNLTFQQAHVINRTANKRAWFMECKNRHNRSAITLPYSFLPSMAAPRLRAAAELIKAELKDYDALHVRRGDKVKVHKDKSGVLRSMYANLDRDTHAEAILERIKPWIPAGRTLYIASDERQIHYFDKLSLKYRVVKSENFSAILDPVVQNNYELFMVERLVLVGAKTLVKTWKEDAGDLSLSDEAKKKAHRWEHAVTDST